MTRITDLKTLSAMKDKEILALAPEEIDPLVAEEFIRSLLRAFDHPLPLTRGESTHEIADAKGNRVGTCVRGHSAFTMIFLARHHRAIVDAKDTNSTDRAPEPSNPPRTFPIMNAGTDCAVSEIPWEMIAPFEAQAKVNHGQTLEQLAQRGGLSPREAAAVMTGRKLFSALPYEDAKAFLEGRFSYIAALQRRVAELEPRQSMTNEELMA